MLVDFWTYSCINCLRALPYVKLWYEKYKDHGLVIIGVHAPEFAFEKDLGNVQPRRRDLGRAATRWRSTTTTRSGRAFNNQYWPAHYFIDANGRIRGHHFGEGEYANPSRSFAACSPKPATPTCPRRGRACTGERRAGRR